MTETLQEHLNEICSYLIEGEIWHRRAANSARMNALRGWGRWHDAESCGDSEALMCLEKILVDHLDFIPTYYQDNVIKAMKYTITDIKGHHREWAEREDRLIMSLNGAIEEARMVSMCLYDKLCKLQHETQNERMRIDMIYKRLDLAGWNGHDMGVCSMVLHKYFEHEYDGGEIDINLG